jgi:hypothetical protein
MAHYAQVINGIVQQVIVAEQDFIDSGAVGNPADWVQTSYNTQGGIHLNDGTPLRKNYAGIGFIYDAGRDAFYAPAPYPSWVLDEATCYWNPPIARPEDTPPTETEEGIFYTWDESIVNWKAETIPALGTPT